MPLVDNSHLTRLHSLKKNVDVTKLQLEKRRTEQINEQRICEV